MVVRDSATVERIAITRPHTSVATSVTTSVSRNRRDAVTGLPPRGGQPRRAPGGGTAAGVATGSAAVWVPTARRPVQAVPAAGRLAAGPVADEGRGGTPGRATGRE